MTRGREPRAEPEAPPPSPKRPAPTEGAEARIARVAALAQAFELATRLAHARAHAEGLYPAQWAAMRYFKTAVGERRTAMALARYQGLAFGPVSRTVRTLIARGVLRKAGSTGRGRGEAIELTAEGEALLARDPLTPLIPALRGLSPGAQDALAGALEVLLQVLALPEDKPGVEEPNSPQK